jgi:hypothetical protein
MASVVSLKDFLDKNPMNWNTAQNNLIQKIFLALSNKSTVAAQ